MFLFQQAELFLAPPSLQKLQPSLKELKRSRVPTLSKRYGTVPENFRVFIIMASDGQCSNLDVDPDPVIALSM
jgi:hypothetical protein